MDRSVFRALRGGGLAEGAETGASPKRPNVVVFLADDAGWGDFRCLGNTNATTPHVDSLARDGAKVEWFYVCPVCSPTRAEFLTGRYHGRCGVRGVSTGQERLNLDERTIADAFRAAGYATGCFGKWHNGSQWPYHPNARGSTSTTGSPRVTGGSISIPRWSTTANRCVAGVSWRTISPPGQTRSSRRGGTSRSCATWRSTHHIPRGPSPRSIGCDIGTNRWT